MKSNLKLFNEKRDNGLAGKLFHKLYKIERPSFVRPVLIRLIWHILGTRYQFFSRTIRRIFKDYYNVEIGMYSHGECFVPGAFSPSVKIGRYCSFANGVRTHWANHPINTKSTHAFFFNPGFGYLKEEIIPFTNLVIGNDVWIGQNALILPGCKSIGDGSIIAAGAVVNKDVPPYSIMIGNPARAVMKRFSDAKIEELMLSKWWEKSIEELETEIETFTAPFEGDSIR